MRRAPCSPVTPGWIPSCESRASSHGRSGSARTASGRHPEGCRAHMSCRTRRGSRLPSASPGRCWPACGRPWRRQTTATPAGRSPGPGPGPLDRAKRPAAVGKQLTAEPAGANGRILTHTHPYFSAPAMRWPFRILPGRHGTRRVPGPATLRARTRSATRWRRLGIAVAPDATWHSHSPLTWGFVLTPARAAAVSNAASLTP
jgi:hypothetical protein